MLPSQDSAKKTLDVKQPTVEVKQTRPKKKKGNSGQKDSLATATVRGATVKSSPGATPEVSTKKPSGGSIQSSQTLQKRSSQKLKNEPDRPLSFDDKRFQVPKHSNSDQHKVMARGTPVEKAQLAAKEVKGIVMTLHLDDLVVKARELDADMKACKAQGQKYPLQNLPDLKSRAMALIKEYEQYLLDNPDEARSIAVLRRQAIQFHTGKHQIIRLSICHLKSQMLPLAEAIAADMEANLQTVDLRTMAPYIKKYLGPYIVVMIELEQLRKLVTLYGTEKETFLEPCHDHMRRVAHSLNLFAKLFADLAGNYCSSETTKQLLLEMNRRSMGVIDDCLSGAWEGHDSVSAGEFWRDRLHYVVLVGQDHEFAKALAGVDLCFAHFDSKACLDLIQPVITMAQKQAAVLQEGSGQFFELKTACEMLEAVERSLADGFLKFMTELNPTVEATPEETADTLCQLNQSLSALKAYKSRVEVARLREKKELDDFLEEMKSVVVTKSQPSHSTGFDSTSDNTEVQTDDEKSGKEEVKSKTDSVDSSDSVESTMAEAARLLRGYDQNPSRALFLYREALKHPKLSDDQKVEIRLGVCEACLADGSARLEAVIKHRKHLQIYAGCFEQGQTISSADDKAFVAAVQELPQLQQELLCILERARAIVDAFTMPEIEGDLKISSEMVMERMKTFLTTCQSLVDAQVDLAELFRMRGEYIRSHLTGPRGKGGVPLLTVGDVKFVSEVDSQFDEAVEALGKAVEHLQSTFQRQLHYDDHFPPLIPAGDKG